MGGTVPLRKTAPAHLTGHGEVELEPTGILHPPGAGIFDTGKALLTAQSKRGMGAATQPQTP